MPRACLPSAAVHYGTGSRAAESLPRGAAGVTAARVLVTGASGQLASAVLRAFDDRQVTAHTRATLDVTDIDAVHRAVDAAQPDLIVNCAAFNRVDDAEHLPAEAFAINAFALRTLARAADAHGAVLVHYGSDFVFAGIEGPNAEPYDESTAPSP